MHPLIKFSFKNLTRSKIRSILSIAAVFLGVLLITTLLVLTDSLVASVNDSLAILSGVVVVQEKYAVDPTFSSINTTSVDQIIAQNNTGGDLEGLIDAYVEEIWHIEKSDEGLFGFTQVIGLTPSKERETVGVLNPSNFGDGNGRTLTDDDYNATVIGSTVATTQGYEVGDYVRVSGNFIKIVGIYQTDSFIDASMFMPIELVRTFSDRYTKDKVSTLLIKPIELKYGDEIKNYVNKQMENQLLEASDFDEIADQGRQFLDLTTDYALYIGTISIVIGSLSVANSILMGVYERKREIAILKATGWTDREVGIEVFIESIMVAAVGGIFGLLGGIVIATYFTSISSILDLTLLPLTLVESYIYAVLLGVTAGLYPAFRAMQIDPVDDIAG